MLTYHEWHSFESNFTRDTSAIFVYLANPNYWFLITLQDLLSLHDRGVQVDLVVLDLVKAFDTVPHKSLLGIFKCHEIDSNINQWVRAFLANRFQQVIVDGSRSDRAAVASVVARRTMLGSWLFLLHINGLPCSLMRQKAMWCALPGAEALLLNHIPWEGKS